jgi:hypothetical protein
MKYIKAFLAALFLISVYTNAWAGSAHPESMHLFAYFPAPIALYLGGIIPPVYEYKLFTEFQSAEESTSPGKFDAVMLVRVPQCFKGSLLSAHFEVSSKVGPLLEDPEFHVTDITAGQKAARWRKPEITKTIKVVRFARGALVPVYLKDINLEAIYMNYYNKDQWPYFIKVTAWLSCPGCDSSKKVSATAEIVPGD